MIQALAAAPPPRVFTIAAMRPRDAAAIRRICVQTCWRGGYRPDAIPADWFWAEYWTRYFTDLEPGHTWVVLDGDDDVVGYLTGTADARRLHRHSGRRMPLWAAWLVWQAACGPPIRWLPLAGLVRSALRCETHLPRRFLAQYPATWHFNLVPTARRHGLGSRLVAMFLRSDERRRRLRSARTAAEQQLRRRSG
jgi:hypothetical protein